MRSDILKYIPHKIKHTYNRAFHNLYSFKIGRLHSVFNLNSDKKNKILPYVLAVSISCSFLLSGCYKQTPEEQNKAFCKFTKELFLQETASNTISLHYTLKNPEEYGIKETPITFGSFETDGKNTLASVENIKHSLEQFHYENLSVQNQLTYDVINYYMECLEEDAEYVLYDEPLGLVSGIQTQLPVLLSEYQFYQKEDVDIYLELLKIIPDYFQSLSSFEHAKSDAGLFMSDNAARQVIAQCDAFMNMGESNYLITTFVERIEQVNGLTEKEKSTYIQRNALMLNSYILPAYSRLAAEIQKLMGTGNNEQGLCYLPDGKKYYEQVVKSSTGSERSVLEMKELTQKQIVNDLEAMEKVLGITENQTQETASMVGNFELLEEAASMEEANPVSILNKLKKEIANTFPVLPDTTVSVKYVPEALEEHLSPAFYMIPAIDSYEENVIYVNQSHMGNPLTLYTTLAHEGYPGHLYQTVYYAATDPDPVRSMFNFGGYVEGWATYAEMCSYYLAPLTKEQATILQKNSSIILGLYTLADIGIHYEGWSRVDTAGFFSNYGIKDVEIINRIYDLILGSPGNYLKYYIGYVEFLELKKEWAAEKGQEYSQKEFHEAVLNVGPAPFEIVDKYMEKVVD